MRRRTRTKKIGPVKDFSSITPEEAIRRHSPGDVHIVAPYQWAKVAGDLVTEENAFLRGRLGVTLYGMIIVDTDGLTPEETEIVLSALYGSGDIGVEVGEEAI
jgi:hypothetical protein